MSKQYAYLHTMAKPSVKFQNCKRSCAHKTPTVNWWRTDESRHAHIAPLTQVRQKQDKMKTNIKDKRTKIKFKIDIEDLTRVVISYEIYETSLWQVS